LYWSSYRSYDTSGVYEVSGLWSDGSTAFRDSSPCVQATASKKFAEILQNSFSGGQLEFRKTVERDDYLPAHSTAPCILYEGGFISNDSESVYLNSESYRESASNCFLQAINSYFGNTSADTDAPTLESLQSSCGQLPTTDAVITLTATGVSDASGVESVKFPVWTSNDGQDDIRWYDGTNQGNGVWTATVDIDEHNSETGLYNAHVYTYDTQGNVAFRGATSFTVTDLTGISDGASIIKNSETTASAYIKGVSESGFTFAVWSDTGGQDDLIWEPAVRQTDGSYKAVIRTSDHNSDFGIYHVHAYSSAGIIAAMQVEFTGMTASNLSVSEPVNGQFTIRLNGVESVNGVKQILFPVWSANGGQDDIVWYTAQQDGDSYTAVVNLKEHGWDTGMYFIHVYGTDNQNHQFFLNNSTVTVPSMSASTLSVSEPANGSFTVTLSGISAPSGISTIYFPVWSDAGGQDDIKWYTATRSGSSYVATIKLSDHNWDTGRYSVHTYGVDSHGKMTYLLASSVSVQGMSASSLSVSTPENGYFTIRLTGITAPSGISQISFPVWSANNGQDDIKWYTATRSGSDYICTIYLKDHGWDTGNYWIHAYGTDAHGKTTYLNAVSVAVPKMTASSVSATDPESGSFTVTISGLITPNGVSKILVPIWSEKNGQDDIVWYEAQKNGSTYTVNVNLANHRNDTGLYNIHVYGVDSHGIEQFLGSTTMTCSSSQLEVPDLQLSSDTSGHITVTLSGVTGYSNILFPVWSADGGQDDIVWYQADQSDSTATCTVNITNHGSKSGLYHVHAYGTDPSGTFTMIGASAVQVELSATSIVESVTAQTKIMGNSSVTAAQLVQLYTESGKTFPSYYTDRGVDLNAFAQMYIDEASAEGVRADIAFAQAMLETGYLQFTGDVKISQFNFAGLGATGNGVTGEDFSSYGDNSNGIRMGIRAQIQHLKAYASTDPLNNEQIDNRFGYVTRGCAPTVGQLSGTWAGDTTYGTKIAAIAAKISA